MINKNSWVQIRKIVLQPNERSLSLPKPTQKVPLVMWTKGYLQKDASIGETVTIKTLTGRIESGILVLQNPSYKHNYGDFIPEILEIDQIVKTKLFGGKFDE